MHRETPMGAWCQLQEFCIISAKFWGRTAAKIPSFAKVVRVPHSRVWKGECLKRQKERKNGMASAVNEFGYFLVVLAWYWLCFLLWWPSTAIGISTSRLINASRKRCTEIWVESERFSRAYQQICVILPHYWQTNVFFDGLLACLDFAGYYSWTILNFLLCAVPSLVP